jgi:hypothetical protein
MKFYLKCKSCGREEEVSELRFWCSGGRIVGRGIAENLEFCNTCITDNRSRLPWSNTAKERSDE